MEDHKYKSAAELRVMREALGHAGEVIGALFDASTFVETGVYVKRGSELAATEDASEFEGVITGYGAVNGRLVFAFIQDAARCRGAVTAAHADKICALYDLAAKSRAPVIGIFASSGAAVLEGVDVLAGYGRIMRKSASLHGLIPQLAVVDGICSGLSASLCSMFDFVIANEHDARLYIAPPSIMKAKFNVADASAVKPKAPAVAAVDLFGANTADAVAKVRALLAYLPSSKSDGTICAVSQDDPNRASFVNLTSENYDMLHVIATIADRGAFFELQADTAPEILTGFITLNGRVTAFIANQPAVGGGLLTAGAAHKAAKLIGFAASYGIPLLTLVDCGGFEFSIDSEFAPYTSELAALAAAYADGRNAKVTVTLGRSYGAAFTLLGSKALGADIAFALDCAKISIMPPESAVEFVFDAQIKASEDPAVAREKLLAGWNGVLSSPVAAARSGEIDDIISADELRRRTAAAFEMLAFKNGGAL
jgi:Acetyl-CoA carboxylase, carboxyltransferase component (subunits alpha and beta)